MSYVLSFDEPGADAVEAVRREQLEKAAAGLRADPTDAEAIHDARKRLKKTRSLLRLSRPAMKRKAFRKRNRFGLFRNERVRSAFEEKAVALFGAERATQPRGSLDQNHL